MNQMTHWKTFSQPYPHQYNYHPNQILHSPNHRFQAIPKNYQYGSFIEPYKPKEEKKEECDGLENFLKDIEIISLLIGIASLFKGILSLIGASLSIIFTKINVYLVGVPSRILTILRRTGVTIPENIETLFSTLEIIFTAMETAFWIPFEQFNNFLHFLGEALAVVSLSLAAITTFSDLWKHDLEKLVGPKIFKVIEDYGCRNKFDSERLRHKFWKWLNNK